MGRIHDALKKAQEEREKRRGESAEASTPTLRPKEPSLTQPMPIKPQSKTTKSAVLPQQEEQKSARVSKKGVSSALRRMPNVGESPVSDLGGLIEKSLLSYHLPSDFRSEQFRALRTNISVLDPSPEILAITSAVRGEGANVTAANLGICFAEGSSERVLLVDFDLREARLESYFGLSRETPGVAEVLSGRLEPEQAVSESGIPGLAIVPAGPAVANPGGLITGVKVARALTVWRSAFDRVIVVSPPAGLANDSSVIGHEVDGVLLIVKLGVTPRRVTERAVETLATSGVRLLGCVLTNSERPGDLESP